MQYKDYVKSCTQKIQVLHFGTLWEVLFSNIFSLWLVEFTDTEPTNTESRLYFLNFFLSFSMEV